MLKPVFVSVLSVLLFGVAGAQTYNRNDPNLQPGQVYVPPQYRSPVERGGSSSGTDRFNTQQGQQPMRHCTSGYQWDGVRCVPVSSGARTTPSGNQAR